MISAPENLRGMRVLCPACGAENQLRDAPGSLAPPLGAALPAVLPSSRLAAERLEDTSTVLLAFAYLTALLALATGTVPLATASWAFEWRVLALLAGALASAVLFVSLKYGSEAMRALADVARATTAMEERLDRVLVALEPAQVATSQGSGGGEAPAVPASPRSGDGP